MVAQGWSQYMGEKHSWGPCVVDEAEQAVHDATVEVAAADMAAVETVAVVVPVDTAALALVVPGKWVEEVQASGSSRG
jgi:hypothetical protein